MKKIVENRFNLYLILFTVIIFYMNSNHIIQQGTLVNYFIPLAKNLINNFTYSIAGNTSSPSFYPLWGYTFLLIPDVLFNTGNILILITQIVLSIISINLFYKIFNIQKKLFHLLLFIPFISIMSTKTPDAIVCFLIIIILYLIYQHIKTGKLNYLIFAGISQGVLLNFRSEYLYLFIFLLIITLIIKRNYFKQILKISLVIFGISIIVLLPWAIRSFYYKNELNFTATNGGAVLYISLGQLPNNKWNIQPYDETAYKIADSLNFENPYTPKADKYFKTEFLKSVKKYPVEYIKKVAFNFFSSLTRGVYTGEFANLFIDSKIRYNWERNLNKQNGLKKKIEYIFSSDYSLLVPIIFEKLIQFAFIPIFFFLIIITFKKYIKNELLPLDIILLSFILYKFVIVSLIQYEYRHMNSIYLILLGIVLSSGYNFKLFKKERKI